MKKEKDETDKNARRICIKCGKKKYIKHMVEVGEEYGRYYQANRIFKTYQCKPNALDPDKCR